jgi:SPP1 family predicted phage head-tail adaptor
MMKGRLRHRVKLQSSTETRHATTGEPVKVWSTYATVWARVEPLLGQVALVAQQVNAELTHRVTIRYHPSFRAVHRIVYEDPDLGTRIFYPGPAKNIEERNVYQEILCKEAVG